MVMKHGGGVTSQEAANYLGSKGIGFNRISLIHSRVCSTGERLKKNHN